MNSARLAGVAPMPIILANKRFSVHGLIRPRGGDRAFHRVGSGQRSASGRGARARCGDWCLTWELKAILLVVVAYR